MLGGHGGPEGAERGPELRRGRKLKAGVGGRIWALCLTQCPTTRRGQRGRGHSGRDQRRLLEKETFELGLKDRQDLHSKGERPFRKEEWVCIGGVVWLEAV